jgi:hypothetical protein
MTTPAKNLIESFNSETFGGRWINWGGAQCVATDGKLKIDTTTSANYYGIDSQERLDLTGSELVIEVLDVGNQSLASLEVNPIDLLLDTDNHLLWLITNGDLGAYKKVAGTLSLVASVTYNATDHRWLRIRESGGTIYWDASPDRSTWTQIGSLATPFAITSLLLTISIGTWQAEASASSMTCDNLNIITKDLPGNIGRTVRVGNGASTTGGLAS